MSRNKLREIEYNATAVWANSKQQRDSREKNVSLSTLKKPKNTKISGCSIEEAKYNTDLSLFASHTHKITRCGDFGQTNALGT